MSYLKKVTLINFQSHTNSVVEFDKSLNIIVGPSDSGKTAIIRGIKWALYNEPSGDFFIREGETEASVTLEFSNSVRVKRLRSKSKNAYILYNVDGEETIFEGFGNKVPQEIIDLIGIKKIPLDTNETNAINLGEQLEGAFLLSEKGSTRASAIGRLIGVNLIDDALKDTIKDHRNISIRKKTIAENIKTIEKELLSYEYLDNLKEKIIILDSIKDKIKRYEEIKTILTKILESYNNIYAEKVELSTELNKLKDIYTFEENINKLEKLLKIRSLYNNIQIRIDENEKQIKHNKKLTDVLVNNNAIELLVRQIERMNKESSSLKRIKVRLDEHNREINQINLLKSSLNNIEDISISAGKVELQISKLSKLKNIGNKLKLNNDSIKTGRNYLSKLKSIDEINNYIIKLDTDISKIKAIINIENKINIIRTQVINQKNEILEIKADISKNLGSYQEVLIKSEVCPFCLSHINEDKIDHIIAHYT